ncbi:glucosamine-6-phosphate deaminase [Algibacter amylolyticus]|uniref:Glucosamine-6-phosphate deaminase n=1 Tax=Algibacter amylolyticus TaxID=1608400 RepID=A0A5M7B184_9FLAO|nr:glucosamine-6-phosphate deaminase [Algibacter amylolyticus]KAA5823322.1 glucosamine-6-phosphate deaminase [Algibacter amylolyticus]MBB5267464.1 glucosamine-6-phosphate deaminase [Algibacter amylolyticus]TSJ73810.1 glucosamine-6-phosphate deaminase [Algibacter amylolyticus]
MPNLNLNIHVFPTKEQTGNAAGKAIETCIVNLQKTRNDIRIIFAAAPSQDAMLNHLSSSKLIDWSKITAFNMDEYIGLKPGAPQLFSSYLQRNLFSKVDLKEINTINTNHDVPNEIEQYEQLLTAAPIDIVCLGIGENGHIAFNDPPVADFNDPQTIKVVELDHACRVQQVNDGCFKTISDVPKKAITLTIPTLNNGTHLFCVVVGHKKNEAVKNTLSGIITTTCPASILTKHPDCSFYFDAQAYKGI